MEKEDAQLRQALDALARALRAKDVDALMAHYAPDVVTYDVLSALQCRGVDAYRKNFEAWFGAVEGPIDYQIHDLQIAMSDEVAFSRYLGHVRTTRKRAENADYWTDYWVRVTAGCQKRNGRWMIVHEHISIPIDMKTMQAASGLRP
jgi:ketosteroid isomerase-like protein